MTVFAKAGPIRFTNSCGQLLPPSISCKFAPFVVMLLSFSLFSGFLSIRRFVFRFLVLFAFIRVIRSFAFSLFAVSYSRLFAVNQIRFWAGVMSFRIANDPETDYRAFVRAAYDRCAMDYANQRSPAAGAELNLIEERLAPGSGVLDVGCGAGIPVSRQLADKFEVTGVDISSSMIGMARKNVPSATFIRADVLETGFPAACFDAIVSYYAIFHIPRQEHRELFRRFARWIRPGGLLLFTVAPKDDGPGYTEDGFFGETMYWSNFGPGTYRKMLAESGFRIEQEGIAGGGRTDVDGQKEVHPYFSAKRKGRS